MKTLVMGKDAFLVETVFREEYFTFFKTIDWDGVIYTEKDLTKDNASLFKDAEQVFSVGKIQGLSESVVKNLFPSLKRAFVAQGDSDTFSAFLKNGIKVYSGFAYGAVSVSEYVFAQTVLANKGYFMAERLCRINYDAAKSFSECFPGNYDSVVGLLGLGVIGSKVAEKLKSLHVKVLAFDPYCTKERANSLNVSLVDIQTLFEKSDVISNHLDDKPLTEKIISYEYLSAMKEYAVMINTAIGRQIDENALLKAFSEVPTRTAILDVDPSELRKEFLSMPNVIVTPRLAMPSGEEIKREGDYLLSEYNRVEKGLPALYEIKEI